MRKTLSILALGSLCAVLSFGENYSGKLVDASCYSQQKKATGCEASAATTTFALDVNGKVYVLDANGNTKATSAMKNRADRAADPNNPSKGVMATVTGTESGGTITVETIDVQ
jgi:hypothetical protein